MSNRRAADSMKSTIDAAALQADMARRFNLPGNAARKSKKTSGLNNGATSKAMISSSRSSIPQIYCISCMNLNPQASNICNSCGYFLTSAQHSLEPSLAELRGLVKSSPKIEVMVESEWDVVESKLAGRNDAFCPICMEAFKDGREVLLSCSHMFHRTCLTSFEKFMKNDDRSCPICRTTKYQKKVTRQGSKAFEVICAIKVQTIFRGFSARRRFYINIRSHYQLGKGGISNHRTKFYENELNMYTNKMDKDFDDRKKESDSLLSSVDNTLNESRQLDLLFETMLQQRVLLNSAKSSTSPDDLGNRNESSQSNYDGYYADYDRDHISNNDYAINIPGIVNNNGNISNVDWKDVLSTAKERGFGECAICMCQNVSNSSVLCNHSNYIDRSGQRLLILLSCSHIFHQQCVQNFERFLIDDQRRACPVCRCCDYTKKTLTSEEISYGDSLSSASEAKIY